MTTDRYLSNLFGLHGRRALVTGAANGNGLAIAEALLRAGAEVWMVDKDGDGLLKQSRRFRKSKLNCHVSIVDLTAMDVEWHCEIKDLPLDILVNCAGVTGQGTEVLEINLMAPVVLSRLIVPGMAKRKRGSIINVTSLNDRLAFPNNADYMMSKAALGALTRSIATDYGAIGVRANNLRPGYFQTNMTQESWNNPISRMERTSRTMLGKWGLPKDLAGAVIFLASDASSYVTGTDLVCDGGWSSKGL